VTAFFNEVLNFNEHIELLSTGFANVEILNYSKLFACWTSRNVLLCYSNLSLIQLYIT